jgi:hypothetical protein
MVFYVYKIKGINYVGSTKNIKRRCWSHKSNCWNENSKEYNLLTYQYIREKNINIELEILFCYRGNCSIRIQKLVEQFYINKFDSVKNGFNNINAFGIDEKHRKKYVKKYMKKYREKNNDKIKETNKKYWEENKDKLKKQRKKKYEKNKEKINQKRKIKITCCLCGSLVRKSDIKKHQRTKKCKSLSKVY